MATQLLPAGAVAFSPTTRIPDPEASIGPLENFGFYSLVLYLFLIISRAPELIAVRFGSSFYQIFIASILCSVFVIVSGSLFKVVGTRLAMVILALHFWYMLSVPFSTWRTGSLESIITVARVLPLFFFIAAMIKSEKHLRTAFATIRLAMLVALAYTMSAPMAESEDSRLMLEGSRFANSNEIAMYLLIGLPFWLHMAVSKRFNLFIRLLACAEIALSLFQCLRTGSRGGLITILLLGVVLILLVSPINKLKLVVLAAVIALVAFPVLPSTIRERLFTIAGDPGGSSAAGSSESRRDLLLESIRITAAHPILGVGIGVYASAAADISELAGRKKRWQVTHNTFTQISSECGIPALILFIWTLVITTRITLRARKLARAMPAGDDLALMSGCVLVCGLVYVISGCFANIGQELFYYMICGFAFACASVAEQRYAFFQSQQAELARDKVQSEIAAARPSSSSSSSLSVPAAPVIGRPPAVTLEDQYGDVPWAKSPQKPG